MKHQNEKVNDYAQILKAAGLKITRQRQVILDILMRSEHHPNALDIFHQAVQIDKNISLSTVYRTMRALEDHGAIHRHIFAGGPSRFETADSEHHDHLIDVDTGKVVEFHSPLIEKLQKEIAHQLGYEIIYHRFELYGRKRRKKS